MATSDNTPALQLPHTRTITKQRRPKAARNARKSASRSYNLGGTDMSLLQVLWDGAQETITDGGEWTDTFIGPNRILRKGILLIQGDDRFDGVRFQSVITLGKLVPRRNLQDL